MFCKNCGSELPDSAKFCSKCGSSQKPSDTAIKQLNDYLEVLKHIKDSNNNSSSVDSEEVEEKVCTTIIGVFMLLYIIAFGLSLKSFLIGGIIGYIIGWLISKVIGFLYKIISGSGNFVKGVSAEYWKQSPIYIKVKQLQETACQKYMHTSIAEFEKEKFNEGFGENRRISDLLKLSEQKPDFSLERLIDTYYSGLFRQVTIERIFDLIAELEKLKRCHEAENNKYPAETMQRLFLCEDSLEKLIDDSDNISDLEFSKRVKEVSKMFNELHKEFESIKNKAKQEEERLKKEEEQRQKEEAERRKREEEQRRKPACHKDVPTANTALYNLKYEYFYNEQWQKFDSIRSETDTLVKNFYQLQIIIYGKINYNPRGYDYFYEDFYKYHNSDEKKINHKMAQAENKLISVINHTIDAIQNDNNSLIARLSNERAEYEKLFEEAIEIFGDYYFRKNSDYYHEGSDNYLDDYYWEESDDYSEELDDSSTSLDNNVRTTSSTSSGLAGDLVKFGLAYAGMKILYRCGDCAYYSEGFCYMKRKMVNRRNSTCLIFVHRE